MIREERNRRKKKENEIKDRVTVQLFLLIMLSHDVAVAFVKVQDLED
jgi:hypothetical protein